MSNLRSIPLENSIAKVREPEQFSSGTPVVLMLHGFSGDENSMWAFAPKIPKEAFVFSLRAPYSSHGVGLGGYTWIDQPIQYWPVYQDFFPTVKIIRNHIVNLSGEYPQINFNRLSIVGFSQGGAVGVVFANLFRGKIEKLALLSSFLPDSSEGFLDQKKFADIQIFIAHGEKDEMVGIELAEYSANVLSKMSANMIFCRSNVGHQLGSDCFNAFGDFFAGG
ncbi:hypothetical protein KQH54_02970 [bacterium]|nr:hypothetical protein [bacterium]